ncbi:MAG: hypothetical protein WAU91_13650, partial [Desulfatitalea sp.]
LATVATAAGTSGSYAATPLNPASSWQAGGPSGSFTWSYPVTTPPVPGNLAPSVGIGYDSGSVDGRVATTNNQPSWVGDGFDIGAGYIERRYMACADDMGGTHNNTVKTGDLCWKSDNATISFGGRSGPMVKDTGSGVWKLYDDDGSKLTHYGTVGATSEYWTLTDTAGTVYTFGKGTGAVGTAATKSAWTVPVFSNQPGEPDYTAGNYAGSARTRVWRWNLDSVTDVHGNAISYFFAAETNRYGQNLNKTVAEYTRGGYLARIEYGLKVGSTAQAVARVDFTPAERCLPSGSITCAPAQLTSANASYWPDVPFDQVCTAATGTVANPATGGCTKVLSPAFFSRIRLTGITTKISTGTAYRDVDRYTITHSFRDPGDGTSKVLWPDKITHVGVASDGTTTLTAPAVTLYPTTQMPNRVDKVGDNAPPINRFRLVGLDNGVGGQVSVGYSATDCTPADKPADPANNTRRCFPVFYTPPGWTDPVLNWFHKYLVTFVDASDGVGGQDDTVTAYQYLGNPAWHFDRDDLIPPNQQTWGQWRGYDTVRTYTGGPSGPWTATEALYLRGMHGDCLNTACTSKRSVSVTDSRGGTISDTDSSNGYLRETRTFNGATDLTRNAAGEVTAAAVGTQVGETLNTPWFSGVHADDGKRQAKIRATAVTSARTYTAAGALARQTRTTTGYNDYGMATQVEDLGDDDTAVTSDDTCTRSTYATDTSHWILGADTSTETVEVACSTTPNRPGDVLSASRSLYDGATAWSANPTLTKGQETGTYAASGWDAGAGALTWTKTATTVFDGYGRLTTSADALGQPTKTVFTPATGGPVTQVVVTNPAGHTVTTTLETGRGSVLTATDANAKVTTTKYDPLGRLTGVWLPGRALTASANKTFAYSLGTATTATRTTSSELRNNGTYTSTYTYYDGQLRPFQTQAPSADGAGNRVVTTTSYDGRGLATTTVGPAWATGAAGSGAATIADG